MAQIKLGGLYENGDGVPMDYGKAIEWYLLAANQEDVEAQIKLGGLYENGDGVPMEFL
ncbi:MAG: tetratricopeptide repeat protein [Leptospirillum sp.]|jgi:TPR repeat protein